MMETKRLKQARDLLSQSKRPLLMTHPRPDGDTIGSALALRLALLEKGAQPVVACVDPVPEALGFLPGVNAFVQTLPADIDLAVAVDLGEISRTGGLYPPYPNRHTPLLVIDHHPAHPEFGDVSLVDPLAPATAMVMVEVLDALNARITAPMATCLLAAILTDTRGLRTDNVTPETFTLLNRLMQAGGDYHRVAQRALDAIPYIHLRGWGHALNHLELEEGIVWTWLSLKEKEALGLEDHEDLNLGNLISRTREAVIAAALVEMKDGSYRISLRSRNGYNVAAIAQTLGGGGHHQAAGCSLDGPLEAALARLLPMLRQERDRHKEAS